MPDSDCLDLRKIDAAFTGQESVGIYLSPHLGAQLCDGHIDVALVGLIILFLIGHF